MHALYPNGTNGKTVEDDNGGWRCMDVSESRAVFSLEDLPPGIIKNLEAADSAKTYLSISSATKLQDKGKPVEFGNSTVADDSATSKYNNYAYHGNNKIRINRGASISVIRGNEAQDRVTEHGGRRLAPSTGTLYVLVVRVSDTAGNEPGKSAAQLSDDTFGTYGDEYNLVSE